MKALIVRLLFIGILIAELYLFYSWLVQPLMPIIKSMIANQGVPQIQIDPDMDHPIGSVTIAGMEMGTVGALITDTFIRLGVFSLLFAITGKIFSLVKKAVM